MNQVIILWREKSLGWRAGNKRKSSSQGGCSPKRRSGFRGGNLNARGGVGLVVEEDWWWRRQNGGGDRMEEEEEEDEAWTLTILSILYYMDYVKHEK